MELKLGGLLLVLRRLVGVAELSGRASDTRRRRREFVRRRQLMQLSFLGRAARR